MQKVIEYNNDIIYHKACIREGYLCRLTEIYYNNYERKYNFISYFFQIVLNITDKKKVIVQKVKLIIENSLPLYYIEDNIYYMFNRSTIYILTKTLCNIILMMVKYIKKVIDKNITRDGYRIIFNNG